MKSRHWRVIVIGLLAYWGIAGSQIFLAITEPRPMYFTWWGADALTFPWSIANELIGDGRLAAIDVCGAILNGLLFALFVRWVYRHRAIRPPSPEEADYRDEPSEN